MTVSKGFVLMAVIGAAILLYAFLAYGKSTDKGLAEYNEGVRLFRDSGGADGDALFEGSQEKFEAAASMRGAEDVLKAAAMYNIGTSLIERFIVEGTFSAEKLETAVARLRDAGRHDGRDEDIKVNLDKLLVVRELVNQMRAGSEEAGEGEIVPVPGPGRNDSEKSGDGDNPGKSGDSPGF